MKFLIVEDNRAHAETIESYVRLWMRNLDIELCFDGAQAVQRAIAQRPDVMLIDQQLPYLNGVEVAARVREHHGTPGPYMMAMTGYPLEGSRLSGIDKVFSRAFAKPLDLDELVATLARLEANTNDQRHTARSIDIAEVLTRVARQLLPLAVARGALISFDYHGPRIVAEHDPIDLHCGLHRLVMQLMELVETTYILLSVEVKELGGDRYQVTVKAAASGTLRSETVINTALERMGMQSSRSSAIEGHRTRLASGRCSNTGAALSCSIDSKEGVLVRAELDVAGQQAPGPQLDDLTRSGQAWVVDCHPVAPTRGERSLNSMGWQVRRFASCEAALSELYAQTTPPGDGLARLLPDLLVVMESVAQSTDETMRLRSAVPQSCACVLAVLAGSASLGDPDQNAGFHVRALPFSPTDLLEIYDASGLIEALDASPTTPAALGLDPRATVLLVDDNAVNRLVGQAMLESLGYAVRVAHDGLDAIDQCRRNPPQVVLMDLDMPVLRGLEAAQHLRELQRLGVVPPLAIVAATSDGTAEAREACADAGMNSFLTKPLTLSTLRSEIQRYIDPAFQSAI